MEEEDWSEGLGDGELLDYGSGGEVEGEVPPQEQEATCGEMEIEPPSARKTSGESCTEDGTIADLRNVIESAKERSRQRGPLDQDLDHLVKEARTGKAQNKGRKRQRAERLDPAKFIEATSARLQEPKLGLLWRALKVLGLDPMQQLLIEVEAIERAGGQLTADGSRRRSPGGVFWNVVKQRVKPEVYTTIFAEEQAKSKLRKRGKLSKKRKKQEAGAVHLEGIDATPEAAVVDFKSLVVPEDCKS